MAADSEQKTIFTTHEVSKLLQVNPRSVINWIEQDLLSSYRTPGGHRRIRRDGLEVCRRIKEDSTNRTTIIAVSGQPELESKVLQAGADCFLSKPLDIDRLRDESRRLLRIL